MLKRYITFYKTKSMEQRKNVLVIGGAGFIGAHLCERLTKEANVICLDNFITSGENNINHLLRVSPLSNTILRRRLTWKAFLICKIFKLKFLASARFTLWLVLLPSKILKT